MLDRTDSTERGRHASALLEVDRSSGSGTAPVVVEVPPSLPLPDWYPDPLSGDHRRWWSGIAWTGYTHPVIETPPTAVRGDAPHRRGRHALPVEVERDGEREVEPEVERDGAVVSPEPDPAPVPAPEPAPAPEPPPSPAIREVDAVGPVIAPLRRSASTAVAVQRYVPPPPADNVPGRVALVLAIAGILAGAAVLVWPVLLPVSTVLLLVAVGTAISAMPRWGRRRGVAIVALVLGVAGLAVGPLALGVDGLQRVVAGDLRPIGIDASLVATHEAAIGETVALGDGVGVTVDGVSCGETRVVDAAGASRDAAGEFCVVLVTVVNGTEMPVVVQADDVSVRVDGRDIAASADVTDLGGATGATAVDPTQSLQARFVAEVPAGSAPERVEVRLDWADGVVIAVEPTI